MQICPFIHVFSIMYVLTEIDLRYKIIMALRSSGSSFEECMRIWSRRKSVSEIKG